MSTITLQASSKPREGVGQLVRENASNALLVTSLTRAHFVKVVDVSCLLQTLEVLDQSRVHHQDRSYTSLVFSFPTHGGVGVHCVVLHHDDLQMVQVLLALGREVNTGLDQGTEDALDVLDARVAVLQDDYAIALKARFNGLHHGVLVGKFDLARNHLGFTTRGESYNKVLPIRDRYGTEVRVVLIGHEADDAQSHQVELTALLQPFQPQLIVYASRRSVSPT